MAVCCLQAAAKRTLSACHPAASAACVRAYLQQQQRIRANIATGQIQTQLLPGAGVDGGLTSDLQREAGRHIERVHVREVSSSNVSLSWSLPPLLNGQSGWELAEGKYLWDPTGRHLTVPCERGPDSPERLLLFLDTHTHTYTTALTPGASFLGKGVCRARGFTLVQHAAAQHGEEDCLSLWDCQGHLLHRTAAPAGSSVERERGAYQSIFLAPGGSCAALFNLLACPPQSLSVRVVRRLSWLSPCMSPLAVTSSGLQLPLIACTRTSASRIPPH